MTECEPLKGEDQIQFYRRLRLRLRLRAVYCSVFLVLTDTFVSGTLLAKTEQLSVEQSNNARFGISLLCPCRLRLRLRAVYCCIFLVLTDTFVSGTLLAKTEQLSVEQSNSARFGISLLCPYRQRLRV